MITIWYFDGDALGAAPFRIYRGKSCYDAIAAMQRRYSWDMFPTHGPFHAALAAQGLGFIWELPAYSRVAVIKG